MPCATVEVYSSETSQWHTAVPLPVPCGAMTSVMQTPGTYWGEVVLTTRRQQLSCMLLLPPSFRKPPHLLTSQLATRQSGRPSLTPPLKTSSAATLSGSLLAMGGCDDDDNFNDKTPSSPAVHVFLPLTNSWVRVITGDLPEPRRLCTAVQLSNRVLMFGGGDDNQKKPTKTVSLGSITL